VNQLDVQSTQKTYISRWPYQRTDSATAEQSLFSNMAADKASGTGDKNEIVGGYLHRQ
jgi:hypothetical protein